MIPQSVYTHIQYASNYNHGAQLVRGEKTYSLQKKYTRNDQPYVGATLFVHPKSDGELPDLTDKGFTTSATSGPHKALAWKDIKLGQVPGSEADEWETWDEY